MKRNSTILGSALLVNLIQLILCVILYTIGKVIGINTFLALIVFIIELFIWFVVGFRFVISYTDSKISSLILAMVYAIIPIFVYTFITFMLSIIIPEANQGWSQFFFALSPVVFINRPGVFLAKIFTSNGYIALFLNCVCMAAAFYVGEILALGFKTGKQKITDRRERADNRYNTHQVAPIKNEEIKENNKQASKRQVDTSKQNKMTRGQDNVNQAPTLICFRDYY